MNHATTQAEHLRRANARLRVIKHHEEVTHNVSLTCRFFGISRSKFYFWKNRYQKFGAPGLREYRRGPRISPFRVPPPLEALILRLREERRYGVRRFKSGIAFLDEVRRRLPVAIQRVQTDHGSEFGSDFTWHLHDLGIGHRRIPPATPEANGKVERSHRTDADEFYRRTTFRTVAQLSTKLQKWEHEYNHRRPHLALNGKTPAERLVELRISDPRAVQRSA